MFKLISAIFTAGVVVGIALVVRQRRLTSNAAPPAETIDRPNGNSTAEPIAVPAERQ